MGALLIAIPFVLLGMTKSFRLFLRVRQANLVYNFFTEFKEYIRYTGAETDVIMKELLSKEEYLDLGKNFSSLLKEESNFCKKALKGIGKTDTVGQLKYLDGVIQKAKVTIEKYEKEQAEKSKLYLTLGVCTGVMATIIII